MNRDQILANATEHVSKTRDAQFGHPRQNLSNIADLWTAYLHGKYGVDVILQATDVAQLMVLLKVARSYQGPLADNYEDEAGYAAIAGELALPQEEPGTVKYVNRSKVT